MYLIGGIIILLLALLSRHNAIVQIFPSLFIVVSLISEKLKFDLKTKLAISSFLFVILSLFSFSLSLFLFPRCIQRIINETSHYYTQTPILMNQIAGACVPDNDPTCFDQRWYETGKNFQDVKKVFQKYPTNTDSMTKQFHKDHPFKGGNLRNMYLKWLSALSRHPINYLRYIKILISETWFEAGPEYPCLGNCVEHCRVLLGVVGGTKNLTIRTCHDLEKDFPKAEIYFNPSPIQSWLWHILQKWLPQFPSIFFITSNFVFLYLSAVAFIKKRKQLLLFTFCVSLGGSIASIVFAAFTPIPWYRYIYPTFISSIMSYLGIIAYLADIRRGPPHL